MCIRDSPWINRMILLKCLLVLKVGIFTFKIFWDLNTRSIPNKKKKMFLGRFRNILTCWFKLHYYSYFKRSKLQFRCVFMPIQITKYISFPNFNMHTLFPCLLCLIYIHNFVVCELNTVIFIWSIYFVAIRSYTDKILWISSNYVIL